MRGKSGQDWCPASNTGGKQDVCCGAGQCERMDGASLEHLQPLVVIQRVRSTGGAEGCRCFAGSCRLFSSVAVALRHPLYAKTSDEEQNAALGNFDRTVRNLTK